MSYKLGIGSILKRLGYTDKFTQKKVKYNLNSSLINSMLNIISHPRDDKPVYEIKRFKKAFQNLLNVLCDMEYQIEKSKKNFPPSFLIYKLNQWTGDLLSYYHHDRFYGLANKNSIRRLLLGYQGALKTRQIISVYYRNNLKDPIVKKLTFRLLNYKNDFLVGFKYIRSFSLKALFEIYHKFPHENDLL